MCKNNFTNENEFDFWVWSPMPDSVCNPSGASNFGDIMYRICKVNLKKKNI